MQDKTISARRGPVDLLADSTLFLVCAFHVLLAASLIFVLAGISPAHAADDSCSGRDLIPVLRKDDPAAYDKMEAAADATPNRKGIFYRIDKEGVAPSFLLGTMHVTDPRVLAMPKAAQAPVKHANTIIIETDEVLDEKKSTAALLSRPDLTMFTDGSTITSLLDDKEKAELEAGLKERGIPLASVKLMKPWLIASFVALPACEMARKAAGASFLDKKIAEDAVERGQKVAGLETMVEQLQAMADLPAEFHVKSLIATLNMGDKLQDVMETMTDLYLTGDIGMIMPMLEAVSPDEDASQDDSYASFEKRIVTDRNAVMAERAAPYFEKGGAFMAVGALHLPGKDGLVELLRRQGYTVTALD
jgi:uncharacterized protein